MHRQSESSHVLEWETLLKAVRRNAAHLAGVAPLREALERAYSETVFNRRRRDVARAAAKEATRQLHESLATGYDAAVSLRHFVKSLLGFRSEKLRQFGIQPRRKRCRTGRKPAPDFELPS